MADKVKLRIKATMTDLMLSDKYMVSAEDGVFTADDGKVYPIDKISELCSESAEYTVWGEYFEDGNKCIIKYTENPDIGYRDCVTSLAFYPDNRELLIMTRDGELSTGCRFDMNDKRQFCRYETPVIPIEFTVNTRTVRNTVKNGNGAILLDYNIETRGVNAQRNRLFIEVHKYDSE